MAYQYLHKRAMFLDRPKPPPALPLQGVWFVYISRGLLFAGVAVSNETLTS